MVTGEQVQLVVKVLKLWNLVIF